MNLKTIFGIEQDAYKNAASDEKQKIDSLNKTLLPIKPRKPGIINDEKVTKLDMMTNYDRYPLEQITVPALIIHAKNVP